MLTFYTTVSRLPEAERLAAKYNMRLQVRPVTNWHWFLPKEGIRDHWGEVVAYGPKAVEWCSERQIERAKQRAAEYVEVGVEYVYPVDAPIVLGMWDEGSVHSFVADSPWTAANAESIDTRRCDRCHTKRYRKKVFLVQVRDGTIMQVGGECAQEMDIPAAIARKLKDEKEFQIIMAERFGDEGIWGESEGASGPRGPDFDPGNALNIAMLCIERWGYVSGRKAEETYTRSTSKEVSDLLFGKTKHMSDKEAAAVREIRDAAHAMPDAIDEAQAWIDMEVTSKGWSEFLQNCKVALHNGRMKDLGFLAFMAMKVLQLRAEAVLRAKGRATKADRALALPAGKTQDIPGEWMVASKRMIDTQFGTQALLQCFDADGNGVAFFVAPDKVRDVDHGDEIAIRAGIKGPSRYGPYTDLTRVQIKKTSGVRSNPGRWVTVHDVEFV